LTLDESKETDHELHKQQVLYLVDKQVLTRCGTITVDWAEEKDWSGFTLISAKPLQGGC